MNIRFESEKRREFHVQTGDRPIFEDRRVIQLKKGTAYYPRFFATVGVVIRTEMKMRLL